MEISNARRSVSCQGSGEFSISIFISIFILIIIRISNHLFGLAADQKNPFWRVWDRVQKELQLW